MNVPPLNGAGSCSFHSLNKNYYILFGSLIYCCIFTSHKRNNNMKTSKFTQALAVVMNTKKVSDKSVSALQASLLRGLQLSK